MVIEVSATLVERTIFLWPLCGRWNTSCWSATDKLECTEREDSVSHQLRKISSSGLCEAACALLRGKISCESWEKWDLASSIS